MGTGPLAGVRVVDFTANMAGPYATMILGDQGADVVKVEPPTGDILRSIGTGAGDVSAFFGNLNRSKRSIALDLDNPKATPVLCALLDGADVVIENFRPGATARLGLDAETVRRDRPRLIHTSITGYGWAGPYGGLPAYDHVIQALGGYTAAQAAGLKDPKPAFVRHGVIDKATAQAAVQAVTAALFERTRTGRGRAIDIRMLDVAVAFLWPDAMMNHTIIDPDELRVPNADTYRLTDTSDGQVAFVLVTSARLKRLATALELEGASELADHGPLRNARGFVRQASQRLITMTTAEAVDLLVSIGIPVAPVVSLDELHLNPQIRAGECIEEFDHPVMGRVRQANPAVRFNDERVTRLRPAPHLGQDTDSVLVELGYSPADIDRLRDDGVVNRSHQRAAEESL